MEDFNVITDTDMHKIELKYKTALEHLTKYQILVNMAVANMKVNGTEYLEGIAELIDTKHQEILDEQSTKLFSK
jgi:hypothetical protein